MRKRKFKSKKRAKELERAELCAKEGNSSPDDMIASSEIGEDSDLSIADGSIKDLQNNRPSFLERAKDIEMEVGQIENNHLEDRISSMFADIKARLEENIEKKNGR